MSGWVKVPEEWFERDEVEDLGADAVMLHLSALAYSARHLTNGRVPGRALRRLWPVDDIPAVAKKLTDGGWWTRTEDGQWMLRDWEIHILAADEVEHLREQSRITSERYRRHKAGDHSMCDRCQYVKRNGASDGVTDKVTDSVSDTPSEPSRAEPNRTISERGERSAVGGVARSAIAPRAPRPPGGDPHVWVDDGSSVTCAECLLPSNHPLHTYHPFTRRSPETAECVICGQTNLHPYHQGSEATA